MFLAEGLRIIVEARDSGRLPEIIAFSAAGAEQHPLAAEIIAATEFARAARHRDQPGHPRQDVGQGHPQMLLGA